MQGDRGSLKAVSSQTSKVKSAVLLQSRITCSPDGSTWLFSVWAALLQRVKKRPVPAQGIRLAQN